MIEWRLLMNHLVAILMVIIAQALLYTDLHKEIIIQPYKTMYILLLYIHEITLENKLF